MIWSWIYIYNFEFDNTLVSADFKFLQSTSPYLIKQSLSRPQVSYDALMQQSTGTACANTSVAHFWPY